MTILPLTSGWADWSRAAGVLIGSFLLGATPATAALPTQSGPPNTSLIQQPQQGATPQPLQPSPPLPPPSVPIEKPVYRPPPPLAVQVPRLPSARSTSPEQRDLVDTGAVEALPLPSDDPLKIDRSADPILNLARSAYPFDAFRAAIGEAVLRNPGLGESIAQREEAEAARNEARARQYPTIDFSLSNFQVLSRAFSNDPQNILERQRPRYRTDATGRLQQPLIDFGASNSRIRAGNARLDAAIAGIEDSSAQIALRAISAWYNVYGYRALVRLGEAFAATQGDVRAKIAERIRSGVAAPGDAAQVESYIASSNAQLADFRRSLANAEAQYAELIGAPAPTSLGRAPVPVSAALSAEMVADSAVVLPGVRAARAAADAAEQDVKAIRADQLPQVTFGVDAGRYGLVENTIDYDARANVTLNFRLFGGGAQRVAQVVARSRGADARFRRVREEAQRDANIALSDVQALEESRAAIEDNYIASRQSRDVLAERFRVARGTLFDLLGAEANYFGVAARYIQTVTELDTARYVLLARTGKLLDVLQISALALDSKR